MKKNPKHQYGAITRRVNHIGRQNVESEMTHKTTLEEHNVQGQLELIMRSKTKSRGMVQNHDRQHTDQANGSHRFITDNEAATQSNFPLQD